MTADDFRELALSFDGAVESEHMHHPDFRANGKIFATLGYPDTRHGMVKLAPSDQAHFVEKYPAMFTPVKGAWGLQGSTSVLLSAALPDALTRAMELAWRSSHTAATKKTTATKSRPTKKRSVIASA